jgi:hypothetical protein
VLVREDQDCTRRSSAGAWRRLTRPLVRGPVRSASPWQPNSDGHSEIFYTSVTLPPASDSRYRGGAPDSALFSIVKYQLAASEYRQGDCKVILRLVSAEYRFS